MGHFFLDEENGLIYGLWKYVLVKEDVFAAPDRKELFGTRGQLVSRETHEDLTDQSHPHILEDVSFKRLTDSPEWIHIQWSGDFTISSQLEV